MELKRVAQRLSTVFKKYRFVILILIIGLILMNIPSKTSDISSRKEITDDKQEEDCLEERLSEFLSLIKGAGECQVILSVASGEEVIYQTNENSVSADNVQLNTVTVTGADREERGLVKQVNPQIYLGAVVICSGGDDPGIRLAIIDAVSKLTGLKSNQVAVLKMK